MSKIFVATEGYYSDYHIVAIFSTKELAEKFIGDVTTNPFNEIELYDLDPFEEQLRQGLFAYYVRMDRQGNTTSAVREDDVARPPEIEHGRGNLFISGDVWATDQQHAIKIVNEKRTQLIANNEWPDVG